MMRAVSSRSHAVFTVTIESTGEATGGHVRKGCLNFVVLAGSERPRDFEVLALPLRQARKMNVSLSALGNVIKALVHGSARPHPSCAAMFQPAAETLATAAPLHSASRVHSTGW